MHDLIDIATMMRKTDAFHDPAEANALLSAGAQEIKALRRQIAELRGAVEALLAPSKLSENFTH